MTQKVQVFNYEIKNEIAIEQLAKFANHRRLRVFFHKGTTCVTCGKVGTRLIEGLGRGQLHWDIYTDDLYPLTVDHIIPKSLGGSDELENLQPMCAGCNVKKGNGRQKTSNKQKGEKQIPNPRNPNYVSENTKAKLKKLSKLTADQLHQCIGKLAYRRKATNILKTDSTIAGFVINPHINHINVVLSDNPDSFLSLNQIYVHRQDLCQS